MREGQQRWLWTVLGLAFVLGLPVVGHWVRRSSTPRCALDGVAIDPLYRVTVVDSQDQPHPFCCIRCAKTWLERHKDAPRDIRVTDEASGREIDADVAFYVRSSVVTTPVTSNRIHAFRRRADAEAHAADFSGVVLSEQEKPLP